MDSCYRKDEVWVLNLPNFIVIKHQLSAAGSILLPLVRKTINLVFEVLIAILFALNQFEIF